MSTFVLQQGSCVNERVDCIVNAANRYLQAGGGVCGAIFSKAGHRELQKACNAFDTPLKDGQAGLTPSFHLSDCKAIIHAVGPDFSLTPAAYQALYDAYYSSLLVMKENSFHSIAFPLISSGIFAGNLHHPSRVSYTYARRAYDDFVKTYPAYSVDMRICAFSISEYNEIMQGE